MSKNKSNNKSLQIVPLIIFVLIGALCGYAAISVTENIGGTNNNTAIVFLCMLVMLYVSAFLHTVIHELGHMVFGLLTGYRFASFRIGKLMLARTNGKLELKRSYIRGIGGQCLMIPPDMNDRKYPYILYGIGGVLANLIFAFVFGLLFLLSEKNSYVDLAFMIFALIGFAVAVINGIPMRLGTVDNDGYNTLSVGKNKYSMKAMWTQLKINEQLSNGIRVKDMPSEWFEVEAEADIQNSMVATILVFACCRAMDELQIEKAKKMIESLLNTPSGIVGLHRNMLIVDLLYCELATENRVDVINSLLSKEQKRFMKSMRNNISVLRTEYAYALMVENDPKKAFRLKMNFDDAVKKNHNKAEEESEVQLIDYITSEYNKNNQ